METGDGGGDKQGDSGGEKRDIRRPMNAFLIFCKRHRSMVREKHPDRDNRSVTRILGDLWANLPDDEKAVYTNLAKTYKDAFMKANPDYKWHSTDRLPQPAKMATRPTNVRPPRSLSTSDALSMGHSEGDKLGGVNLLLLAGKQTMPVGDQPSPHASENDQAPPDLMGANSALLQLAEMCSSSEVAGRHMDSAALRSAPPKKRARHWSLSDVLHTDIADKTKLSSAPLLFQSALHLTKSLPPPPAATYTSQSEPVPQKQDHSYQPPNQLSAMLQRKETEQLNAFKPVNITNQIAIVRNVPFQLKEEKDVSQPEVAVSIPRTETFSAEVGMPPKKKFTKLHDRYKGERPTATTATSTESGCLSDQNDNAIFTCGKLVVDHIIDRLFSANLTSSEHHEAINPSTTDIEKVRKIITADITEREKSQGPSSKEMGKLLSEVVQKPQNLVQKVIEEAYNIDLKRRVKQELPFSAEPCPRPRSVGEAETKPALVPKPAVLGKAEKLAVLEPIPEQTVPDQLQPEMKHDMATMVTTAPLPPFRASSNDDPVPSEPGYSEPVHLPSKPSILLQSGPTKDEREERYVEEMVGDPSKEDGGGDYMQEEEEGYLQPVRKSRRRNRGQRYQELINEGIIQPSKERLAARRHEQVPASVSMSLSSSLFMGEEMAEEDAMMTERSRQSLKRSNSEIEQGALDDKRYRTGDFDLEAEIATLPPCSLDQVPRRRGPRKRSDSENGRRPPGSPTPGQMKDESSSPEPQWGLALTSSSSTPSTTATCTSQPAASAEPLTGSQKRKARKHSINRLVASTDSGSKAKPPGIEASIPMVRDATVSPVRNVQSESTTSTRESSVSAASKSTTCLTSYASAASSLESQSSLPSNKESLPLRVHMQHGKENLVNNTDKIMKTESRFTAERESGVEGQKTFTTEQKLAVSVCDVQTKSSVSVTADNHNTGKRNSSPVKTDFERSVEKSVAEPVSEENVDQTLTGNMHKDGLKENTIYATKMRSDMEEVSVKKNTTVSTVEVKTSAATPNDNGSAVVVGQNKDISSPFTGVLDNSVNQVTVDKVYGENTVMELSSSATGCGIESACLPVSLSPESGVFSENSARENVKRPKRWQLKEALSSDSGQYSSMDVCEDIDRETTPDGAEEEEDKPCVFLSETSGLLCITQPALQKNGDLAGMLVADVSESKEYISQSPKSGFESACDSDDQKGSLAMGGLTPFEDREDAEVDDSALSSIVTMGMEDSLDDVRGGGVVASSESVDAAKVDFSSFSSGATATTGPRVTTVTMTTTDAIPTALSLEMMEEEGMVDSGMGNPMLCGSPMPESPSMTAVHS